MCDLPFDILWTIVRFCPLQQRGVMACLSKCYFPFCLVDLHSHAKRYLIEPTKESLLALVRRDFRAQVSISRRLNLLWSDHFGAPLVVWSPWTVRRFSRVLSNDCIMLVFRQYRFIEFVRDLARVHGLKTTGVIRRHDGSDAVTSFIGRGTTRLEMVINKKNKTFKRYCLQNIRGTSRFLPYDQIRALLEFCVSFGRLRLKVRKLEFVQ